MLKNNFKKYIEVNGYLPIQALHFCEYFVKEKCFGKFYYKNVVI